MNEPCLKENDACRDQWMVYHVNDEKIFKQQFPGNVTNPVH